MGKDKEALRDFGKFEEVGAPVHTLLTDNGLEWTDCRNGGGRNRIGLGQVSGKHAVDLMCAKLGIQHRLTRPRRRQTNGMAERFNRRVSEWLSQKEKIADNGGRNCFRNHAERDRYILNAAKAYNRTALPCLNHRSSLQIIKYNHAKSYTSAGMVNTVYAAFAGMNGRGRASEHKKSPAP